MEEKREEEEEDGRRLEKTKKGGRKKTCMRSWLLVSTICYASAVPQDTQLIA